MEWRGPALNIKYGPTGWIRVARCRKCGYEVGISIQEPECGCDDEKGVDWQCAIHGGAIGG